MLQYRAPCCSTEEKGLLLSSVNHPDGGRRGQWPCRRTYLKERKLTVGARKICSQFWSLPQALGVTLKKSFDLSVPHSPHLTSCKMGCQQFLHLFTLFILCLYSTWHSGALAPAGASQHHHISLWILSISQLACIYHGFLSTSL